MKIAINAFAGDGVVASDLHAQYGLWVGRGLGLPARPALAPQKLPDLKDWADPRVGWGVVLPVRPGLSAEQLARADDAPEPIRKLVAHRGGAPVLRYSSDLPAWAIRRYYNDGTAQDLALVGSPRGNIKGAVPRYLLIYASPIEIPWQFQYRLNAVAFVGRLDLEGEALDNYVASLLTGFGQAQSEVRHAVVWAVDHGGDITTLMRRAIASPLQQALRKDQDLKIDYIDGASEPATRARLGQALADARPGLIVTTSHGMTGPLGDVPRMTAQLGLPVDSDEAVVDPAVLLASWQPDGAIWYAHACCSAGGDARTAFAGLVAAGSKVEQVFDAVAACGARVAPLPRALLGAKRPLRAFIGHVEPTTDWSLRQPETGQLLTTTTVDALYQHLYQPEPVGLAFDGCHQQGPQLNSIYVQSKKAFNDGIATLDPALATRLMAVDRESLVILGDPVVALPALK